MSADREAKTKTISAAQHRAEKRRRKAEARSKTLDYLTYLLVRGVVALLHLLPRCVAYAITCGFGSLIYHLSKKYRSYAIGHLERSFPDWPADKIRHVAKESIKNMVCMGLELFLIPRYIKPQTWRRYVRIRNIEEVLRILITRKTPAMMVTGHFGNWELAGYFSAAIGLPTNSVARRLDNPYINDYIFGVRERAGQKMIYKTGAAEGVTRALSAHETVSMVGDQDAGARGMFVDFLGRQASTYKSIGLMAMQFEAPIAIVCCRRLGRRFRFELFVQRIIHPADWADKDDPLRWITQEFTKAIEEAVRENPEQYFWVHRRWKHRPKGEERPKHGVA